MRRRSPGPKTTEVQTEIKVAMAAVFDWKVIVHHEICTTWPDGKETVIPGNVRVFEECCVQEQV